MDRLTEKIEGSNAIPIVGIGRGATDWIVQSARYMFTQFLYGRAADKLAEYEDLEEQGKLLKLPCKIGTPVYYIQGNCEGVSKEMMFVDRTFFNLDMLPKIGTEFFLTQEQAELALQGMKEREEENGNTDK